MTRAALALGVLAVSSGLAVARSASASSTVTDVHALRHGDLIEVHFATQGPPPRWQISTHGKELWLDLSDTRLDLPVRPLYGREAAPLATLRAVDSTAGASRLIIEVSEECDYAIARLPRELILRLAPAGKAPNIAAPILVRLDEPRRDGAAPVDVANPSHATIRSQQARVTPPERIERVPAPGKGSPRPRVVIDPGHGGHDPGAIGASGLTEKDLALQIARQLAMALDARGVDAILTRSSDEFVTLAQRTRSANRSGAGLFISIHLNSAPRSETLGIETYYLNNTTDRATIRLARIENAAGGYGAGEEPNLDYILADLRQEYKATEAASLARMIEAQAVTQIDRELGVKVNALGAKRGPFYVLMGADAPAVLIECGFLSNRDEGLRLASTDYQAALADAISAAVVHYFNADAAVGNL